MVYYRNMTETIAAIENEQIPLLDLNGRELNKLFVDDNAPLFIPNNPLHWKAHKLQQILTRFEKMAQTNPAQVNMTSYLSALDKYTDLMEQINKAPAGKVADEVLDEGGVAESGTGREETPEVGEGTPLGLDPGISTDNPFSR